MKGKARISSDWFSVWMGGLQKASESCATLETRNRRENTKFAYKVRGGRKLRCECESHDSEAEQTASLVS
jgi:hypothetical protein